LYDPPGDDDLDEVCKSHDLGYDTNGRDNLDVDRKLVKELEDLDPDPRKWSKPPETEEDIAYASAYRTSAMWGFSLKVKKAELEKWLKESPPGSPPTTL